MASKVIRTIISTAKAPAAIGPYSQAVKAGNTLYISGQIGLVPETMTVAEGGTVAETDQALKNIGAILDAAGCDYNNVVKVTVLMRTMADYGAINEVYKKYFSTAKPARAAYAVAGLPKDVNVEIEAIAVVGLADE